MGMITTQTIDEIAVNLEVDTITGAWTVLVNGPDQANFAQIGPITSSDINRLPGAITIIIRNGTLIFEVKIEDIAHIEVNHPELHECRTGITH